MWGLRQRRIHRHSRRRSSWRGRHTFRRYRTHMTATDARRPAARRQVRHCRGRESMPCVRTSSAGTPGNPAPLRRRRRGPWRSCWIVGRRARAHRCRCIGRQRVRPECRTKASDCNDARIEGCLLSAACPGGILWEFAGPASAFLPDRGSRGEGACVKAGTSAVSSTPQCRTSMPRPGRRLVVCVMTVAGHHPSRVWTASWDCWRRGWLWQALWRSTAVASRSKAADEEVRRASGWRTRRQLR